MLYYLSYFSENFGPLRLFDYITFRAGGAAATAFLIVAIFGGKFAAMLRSFNVRAAARYEGILPEELLDKRKNSTPCMGGILLIGAVLLAVLFCFMAIWAQGRRHSCVDLPPFCPPAAG